jgi:hypothetical protein
MQRVVVVLVACAMPNHHTKSAPRGPIAAPWRGTDRPPYLFLAMVILMKVAGIDKINFSATLFFKNRPLLLPAISIVFASYFFDFDMSKTKNQKSKNLRYVSYFDGWSFR